MFRLAGSGPESMKVLLISPNFVLHFTNLLHRNYPNLGMLYIATVISQNGYDVRVINQEEAINNIDIEKIIKEFSPHVVGFSATSMVYWEILPYIKEIKNKFPKIKMMIGGPHITVQPETVMEDGFIDYGIRGEGEVAVVELLNALKNGKDISNILGISYRKDNKIHHNPLRPPIQNLDSIPMPNYDFLGNLNYFDLDTHAIKKPVTTIITSRGCPACCSFCTIHLSSGKKSFWRGYSPDYVVNMLEILTRKYDVKEFSIQDDCFTADMERAKIICENIIRRGLHKKFVWRAGQGTRADCVDLELLKLMKKAGCYTIGFGIESGNDEILKNNGKGETTKQIAEAIINSKKAGLRTTGTFIFGLINDTKDTMEETINFAKQLPLDQACFGILMPTFGSHAYSEIKKKGRFIVDPLSQEFWKYDGVSFEVADYKPELLIEMHNKAYKEFYFRFSYIFRQVLGIRSLRDFKYLFKGALYMLLQGLLKNSKILKKLAEYV